MHPRGDTTHISNKRSRKVPQDHTLILGIGNTLLCDEGAGIHALNLLEDRLGQHEGLVYVDGGTLSFTLAHYIEDCDNMIVFDAAELHSAPGTISYFEGADMDNYLGVVKRSPHEVGLLDLLDIARITDLLPTNRALIGIQPQTMDWSMTPSACVEASLPEAVEHAVALLRKWNSIDTSQDATTASRVNVSSTENPELQDVRH